MPTVQFTFPGMESLSISEIVYPELKTTSRLDSRGANFHIWKNKIDFVFVDNRVKYVLTKPKPPEPSTAATAAANTDANDVADTDTANSDAEKVDEDDVRARYDKWVADDFTARHIILGAISDDLYLQFHHHSSAKALMDALTARFASPSMSRRMVFLKRYVGHRMSEDTPILEHILKMGSLAIDLKLDGVPIPDELQAVMLMNSLPESWNDMISGLLVQMNQEELSLKNVSDRVRTMGEWKVFFKKPREEDNKKNQKGIKGNCYGCGKAGHYVYDCPYKD